MLTLESNKERVLVNAQGNAETVAIDITAAVLAIYRQLIEHGAADEAKRFVLLLCCLLTDPKTYEQEPGKLTFSAYIPNRPIKPKGGEGA